MLMICTQIVSRIVELNKLVVVIMLDFRLITFCLSHIEKHDGEHTTPKWTIHSIGTTFNSCKLLILTYQFHLQHAEDNHI